MPTLNFNHGLLIQGGPKMANGGKWDAMLDDTMRDAHTNAELTIFIRVHFVKINPAQGSSGLYADSDDQPNKPSKRKIQSWKNGEFESFKSHLLQSAQRYWNGVFWLKTPDSYKKLNWPENKPTHRCNLFCRFDLTEAVQEADGHYTIAVVRVHDGENFRSNSRLYTQQDIQAENLIPKSTVKFWTHFHEVGHLLGLGHVNHHQLYTPGLNDAKAYGVTKQQQEDVMGMGSVRHTWHARPWQKAAALLTATHHNEWKVAMKHHGHHLMPQRI